MSGTNSIVHTSEAGFAADVIEKSAEVPVLVDFWAEWCGPCKAVAPILEELVAEAGGKLAVVKVDVDANQQVAATHSVTGIPTLALYHKGAEVDRRVGALQIDDLRAFVKPHMAE